jgi:hypothetical protein
VARRIFDKRHANDPKPAEPAHCAECFEGCPKCRSAEFDLAPRNPAEVPYASEAGVTRMKMEWQEKGYGDFPEPKRK